MSLARLGRKRFALRLEALETRSMLTAGSDVFAVFRGTLASGSAVNSIDLNFRRQDFKSADDKLTVGFELLRGDSAGFDPGPLNLILGSQGGARILERDPDAQDGAASILIADVKPGTYTLTVSCDDGLAGPYVLRAFLVGDTNGNGQVSANDVAAIRRNLGKSLGDAGVPDSADANRDGKITIRDVWLAQHNLNSWTKVRPLSVSAGLSQGSDPDGNGIITRSDIRLVGQTTAGSLVRVGVVGDASAGGSVKVDRDGSFRVNTSVGLGTTTLSVLVTDPFGQTTRQLVSVLRGNEVQNWNDIARRMAANRGMAPAATARMLAILSTSVYDTLQSIDRGTQPYAILRKVPAGASREAAVVSAASTVLQSFFSRKSAQIERWKRGALDAIPRGLAQNQGVRAGQSIAAEMLVRRQRDGSAATLRYRPGSDPGDWRPTAPEYRKAMLPQWQNLHPFVLTTSSQYLAPKPPSLTSNTYADAFNEVKQLGARNSKTRTGDQADAARFWAGSTGTETVVGLWNQAALNLLIEDAASLETSARTLALLNLAEADSGIAAFKAKYLYNTWRPSTAIASAAKDANPNTIAETHWRPLASEQASPSYVSDTSAFSGAAQLVLESLFGKGRGFSITSDASNTLREFASFEDAAAEASASQIYAGTAFRFDVERGLTLGQDVGRLVSRIFT